MPNSYPKDPNKGWQTSPAGSLEEAATGSTRVLHFRDQRPPHEVQVSLERELGTLFTPAMEGEKLCLRAKATVVGADYDFRFCFEAALPSVNYYSLRMEVFWGEQDSSNFDYYRKTSGSWFELWTRGFMAADLPLATEGSAQRYHQLCEEALNSERDLNSIAAVQQAIITAVKGGACFRISHKEGGTAIVWKNGRFVRSDYGDDPHERQFSDEQEFLQMLFQFFHGDVTRNVPKNQLTDLDTWRLIMRRMEFG